MHKVIFGQHDAATLRQFKIVYKREMSSAVRFAPTGTTAIRSRSGESSYTTGKFPHPASATISHAGIKR